MSPKQKKWLARIVVALVLFVCVMLFTHVAPLEEWLGSRQAAVWAEFALFLVPYLIAGYDVLWEALRNIGRGQVFDENFLMSIATIGAFAMVLFPDSDPHMAEGAAVMLFYQVGELFQSYAVGKSRKSISDMMDIAPEFATIERAGALEEVDPDEVPVGSIVVVKPGERIPLDGTIVEGASQLDTAALTGESIPRDVEPGSIVTSGCVNLSGVIRVKTSKPYGESTVARILELVENAADKKARTESFITRFARYYTPVVTGAALLIAVVPPLVGMGTWSDWVLRGLTFLVVSCPCALVISVPLSFFGGIGGASKLGILVKGSNYLELLSKVDTVVFDKTGTLTSGTFDVVALHPESGIDPQWLLSHAAHAEAFSNHPIAVSLREAYKGEIDPKRVAEAQEQSGHGVRAVVDKRVVLVGNDKLMAQHGSPWQDCDVAGTVLHVCVDGAYAGHIVIADIVKPDAKRTISELHDAGVKQCIMLTGDRRDVAEAVGKDLGIDDVRSQLLPQDKVSAVEELLAKQEEDGKLAFVGDGINDAPVLMRADVGIAMGAMGSDAAIEAADIVLMDDKPSNISKAMRVARHTMRIVWQNIVFALGVKVAILILAAVGIANMWLAVFGDVGVAVLAILNAMRSMNVSKYRD